jgi:hypothetical protein
MRKISLDVDKLQVESFEAENDGPGTRGTVHGYLTQFNCAQTQYTCNYTMCGQQCLSGWRPCQPTDAWTDGERMCYCGESGQYAC